MIKKKLELILLFAMLITLNLSAQEKPNNNVKEEQSDDSIKQNIAKSANTDNPPPDQLVETKKTETTDKSGRVQKITTIEFF